MEDKIKPLELDIHKRRQQRDKMNEDIHSIKKSHTIDVLELAKDKQNGLTNQALRDAALDGRLQADPEYQRLIAAVQAIDTELAMLQIDLGHERRKFQVWYVTELKMANGVE